MDLAFANFVFFGLMLVVAIVSIIMFFHWRRYGLGGIGLALTEIIYLLVAVGLVVIAFLNLPS